MPESSDSSPSIPPIVPSEGDDEWQIIDGTPSNCYRSINESESDNNAAIESAAMAAADQNTDLPLSFPDPLPSLRALSRKTNQLSPHSSHHDNETESNASRENRFDDGVRDDKFCRICHEGDGDGEDGIEDFIHPCRCRGSMKYVHAKCLEKWRNMSANPKSFFECDQCKYKYHFSRTRAGEILSSKWSLHLITLLSMIGLVIAFGYVLKLFHIITPSSVDDIIVEVSEHGDIIIKNSTDISSARLSSLSRIYQFLRIDFYHLLYGTVFLGMGGFLSLIARGGGLYYFGGWRSRGGVSNDRATSALEMIIIAVIVMIGLVKASFSVYEMVEKRVNKGLLSARNMVINIPEGE